ncbi:MAG: hypothetical protein K2Q26_11125 [Bdellovibrionales bacterium]|nr:hypothetical protein [Bdellovibrionales bacterium]
MKHFIFLILGLWTLLGFAISRPMSGPGYDSSAETLKGDLNRDVYVAITNAYVIRSKRSLFDRKTQEIYKNLEQNMGYLVGSIRLRLLGEEVWTYTVWESKEALDQFANSRQHVDAMYTSDSAIRQMRSLVFKVKASEIPLSWSQIEEIIQKEKMKEYKPL